MTKSGDSSVGSKRRRQVAQDGVDRANHDLQSLPREELARLVQELQLKQDELHVQNQALLKAQDRYYDLYQLAPVGQMTLDREGTIGEANLACSTFLGAERNQLVGKSFADFVDPADLHILRLHLDRIFATDQTEACEARIVTPDGTSLNARLEGRILAGSDDDARQCQVAVIDITKRLRWQRLQYGRCTVLEHVASGQTLEDILLLLVRSIEEVMPGVLASVLLLDPEQKCLRHAAAPSLPDFYNQAVDGVPIGESAGSCGTAAYTGQRVIVEDVMTHPYWSDYTKIAAEAGIRACWSQPILAADGEILGTFAMYYREPRGPSQQDIEIITTAAQLAGIAIERTRAQAALQRANDELENRVRERTEELVSEQTLLRRLLDVQERERRMVAHDIHDGFVQDVVGAHMQLESILDAAEADKIRGSLGLIASLLEKAIAEGRRLIGDLRPMVLEEKGIVEAIEHLVAEQQAELTVTCKHDFRFDRLEPVLEGVIFRIIQEALSNVKRHAQTRHATVELKQQKSTLQVVIRDKGVGFDPDQVSQDRFGLRGIRERARLFGGDARIESVPGEGTTVLVELPIQTTDDEAHRNDDT